MHLKFILFFNSILLVLRANYCICNSISLNDDNLNQHKLIRIYPISGQQLSRLKEIKRHFQIKSWKLSQNHLNPILVEIEPEKNEAFDFLNKSDIRFEILNKSLQNFIINQQMSGNGLVANEFDYEYTYHSYNKIVRQIRKFKKKHSNFTKIVSIGKSTEGRKIMAIILNNRNNRISKRKVFIECGTHAREWISTAACLWISNQLVNNNTDKELLGQYEFVIIPLLNPDGYAYSWTTDRLWRKTRSKSNKSDCIGTDLNRNWNCSWCVVGASDNPCHSNYCGDSPFSEPETMSLKKFLERNKKSILAYFSLHSYSQLWLYPLGYKNESTSNKVTLDNLSKFATNAIYKIHHQIYEYGSLASIIYPTSGSSVDWVYEKLGVKLCFAIELRDGGFYGFLLPPELIKPTAEEIWAGIKVVIK